MLRRRRADGRDGGGLARVGELLLATWGSRPLLLHWLLERKGRMGRFTFARGRGPCSASEIFENNVRRREGGGNEGLPGAAPTFVVPTSACSCRRLPKILPQARGERSTPDDVLLNVLLLLYSSAGSGEDMLLCAASFLRGHGRKDVLVGLCSFCCPQPYLQPPTC